MVGACIDPARSICLTPGWGCPRHGTPARGALDDLQGSRVFLISSLFALPPHHTTHPGFPLKRQPDGQLQRQPQAAAFQGRSEQGPRGPGQAYIVPFLEFFASESSSGCQQSSVHRGWPGKGERAHHCPAGLQATGMCRDAGPHGTAQSRPLCTHAGQPGPPINNSELTASGDQDSSPGRGGAQGGHVSPRRLSGWGPDRQVDCFKCLGLAATPPAGLGTSAPRAAVNLPAPTGHPGRRCQLGLSFPPR